MATYYINNKKGLAYYNRGIAYGMLGQYDKAIADYKKILLLDPANAEAKLALHDLGVAGY